jgi:hypothetical protein
VRSSFKGKAARREDTRRIKVFVKVFVAGVLAFFLWPFAFYNTLLFETHGYESEMKLSGRAPEGELARLISIKVG